MFQKNSSPQIIIEIPSSPNSEGKIHFEFSESESFVSESDFVIDSFSDELQENMLEQIDESDYSLISNTSHTQTQINPKFLSHETKNIDDDDDQKDLSSGSCSPPQLKKDKLRFYQFIESQCALETQTTQSDEDYYEEEEMNSSDRNFQTQDTQRYDDISLYRLVDISQQEFKKEREKKRNLISSSSDFVLSSSSY